MNRRRFLSQLGLIGLTCSQLAVAGNAAWAEDGRGRGPEGGGPPGQDGHGGPGPGPGPGSGPGGPARPGGSPPGSTSEGHPVFTHRQDDDSISSDEALSARNRGEIVSLKDVLDTATHEKPGKVISVKLFDKKDGAVYRVKTIDDNGIVHTVHVDARTGGVIGLLDIVKRSFGLDEDTDSGR